MKRKILSVILAVLVLSLAVGTAFAAPRTPEADVFVDHQSANQNTNYNSQELRMAGSQDPGGACTPTRTILLRYDVTDVSVTVGGATLTLTTGLAGGSSQAANRGIALYQIANDTWDETTATYANTLGNGSVVIGPQLATATLPNQSPIPENTQITFTDQRLVDYVNAQASGDNKVGLAVQFTSCAATSTQWFQDKEGGSTAATLTLTSPTAVEMTTASAERTSWPLYAGLAAVALVVVAGVMVSKRRTA